RRPATSIRSDRLHMVQIQLRDRRGQEIGRDNHRVFQKVRILRSFAGQIRQQTLNHIFDVGPTFTQVLVVNLRVDRKQSIADDFCRPLGVGTFFDDIVLDVSRELCILEKQQMRVEDVSVAAAEFFFGALHDRLELAPGESDGRAKTPAFALKICFSNLSAIDFARAFLKTQHTAEHDTIRNAQAFAAQLAYRTRNLPSVVLLELIEVAREEINDRVECFLLVFAAGNDTQLGAAAGSQSQDAENRLRIRYGTTVETFQRETTFELARHAYEVGSGACVKT